MEIRVSLVAFSVGLGLAAACSRGLDAGAAGSCAIADPSLATQVQIEAAQENVAQRDITSVNAPRVATLEGVQCLRKLQSLNVESSPISDLSPLAGHPSLQWLLLADATLSNLEPLGTLPHLQSLDVSNSQLDSLVGLAGAPALTRLLVDGNPITSLAGVASLPALNQLSARQTHVDSLAPLAGNRSLASLDIAGSRVTDLAPLATVPGLVSLSISQTAVSDLSPLSGLALQSLWAQETHVADLTPLAASRETLTFLDLSMTPLDSLAPLSGFASLVTLYADSAGPTTLQGLHDLPKLRHMVLSGAKTDLAPLTALSPMWLDVSQLPIDDADLAVVQTLCDAGWAVYYNDTACGDTCLFESCTA